ncbi:ABC transporter permease [Ruminococcus difficilis]|uniref:ABC transporter permease subunit n=1 Tax=Ruminococcus difficilis TaxID=2763069 RepID=A0A934WTC4_9FIRM|nr:ABC transporter permease [Ruminococcus difficilis]MBQ1349627.1 ABC transporter permease subunit [Ruminococcus sp.]SCX09737.1 ABC-2 type transport system permease protein [Ruminococcaceae bacterium P7]MBK6089485.1 ABC transporter permease subunit [Ruminococcus difficilis]MBQ1616361.1 ABC transporter permease subunit [Ruminococcus sp.]MBQ4170933.1 ABC transporter permease subunit [Ruminococcus sp.]
MGAILKRELGAYFSSATAYVVMAVYFFFSGLFFNFYVFSQNSTNLTYVFNNMFYIIMFLIPIITMKTFAEEKKQKSDQALLTSPCSLTEIVLGKFLGAFVMYTLCTCIFLVYAIVISFFAQPQWSVILCTFLGTLLLGGSMIAINVFISVLTESQVVAAVLGMGVGLIISMMSYFVSLVSIEWIKTVLEKISFMSYYENFTYGILSITDVVFFLSVIALFLFFTVRALEKRRWS